MSNATLQQEALQRATGNQSLTNWVPIIEGFMAKGIPANQIEPRVNVLTYHAWLALGRQVRKGEHGIKITTFIPLKGKKEEGEEPKEKTAKKGKTRPWTATVFHISQTDPIQPK